MDMSGVFSKRVGEYEYIIQVHKNKTIVKIMEDVVHEGLEDGRGIGEAKWHHQVLIMSQRCFFKGVFHSSLRRRGSDKDGAQRLLDVLLHCLLVPFRQIVKSARW